MDKAVFYWIGVGVVSTVLVVALLAAAFIMYAWLLHGRFQLIFFRKTERRLSLAAWYSSRLMSDAGYNADDFPIGKRPLLIAYRVRGRHLFLMLGIFGERRHMPIFGQHPEYPA